MPLQNKLQCIKPKIGLWVKMIQKRSRSHTVCLKVSKVTRKQLDRWFWALLLYFSDTHCCPHWGPLGYTSSYTPPTLSSASTRQHPENKEWWGTDEGIQCSLEEVLLLNVAKIWTCHKQDFSIIMDLELNCPTFCLWVPEAWLSENQCCDKYSDAFGELFWLSNESVQELLLFYMSFSLSWCNVICCCDCTFK